MTESALLTRNMPDPAAIRSARLPETYEVAKLAIRQCAEVDECQKWANQAEALASYARQMGDDELRKMADRIQARAIARAGAILKEIEARHTGRPKKLGTVADPNFDPAAFFENPISILGPITRKQAATDAGLSERQRKTALRVANIPEREFEEAIDSEDPPTVTELAERGRQPRPKPLVDLEGIEPKDYQQGTRLLGLLGNFRREAESIDVIASLRGLKEFERANLANDSAICLEWIQRLIERI